MDERNDYNSIPMQHTKTAVEWYHNEIIKKSINDQSHNVLELFQQAKQMEKEQTKAAYERAIAIYGMPPL